MDTDSAAYQPPMVPMRLGRLTETREPGKGSAHFPSIGQDNLQRVASDRDVDSQGLVHFRATSYFFTISGIGYRYSPAKISVNKSSIG